MAAVMMPACETMPWQKKAPPPTVEELEPLEPLEPVAGESSYEARELTGPGLQASGEQRFKDVPLPMGVKPDVDKTFVFESASLQVGRMVYTSRASVGQLAQFYIDECKSTDWELQNMLQAECVTLLFTKPGKRLDVTVRDLGLTRGRLLVLLLTPEENKEQAGSDL